MNPGSASARSIEVGRTTAVSGSEDAGSEFGRTLRISVVVDGTGQVDSARFLAGGCHTQDVHECMSSGSGEPHSCWSASQNLHTGYLSDFGWSHVYRPFGEVDASP